MNAEEKAKAYDEALARAREFYNAAKLYDFTDDMKRLEYIFPELNLKNEQDEQDEWGKEDEDNLRDAIVIIDRYRMETQYADIKKVCERCIDWVKSIKKEYKEKEITRKNMEDK